MIPILVNTCFCLTALLCVLAGVIPFLASPDVLAAKLLPLTHHLLPGGGRIPPAEATLTGIHVLRHSAPTLAAMALLALGFVYAGKKIRGHQGPDIALPQSAISRPEILGIIGLVLLAFWLRAPLMGRSFLFDELVSIIHYLRPEHLVAGHARFSVSNHIGYNLIASPVTAWLGLSEWSLRLPAFIFGLSGIAALWAMARLFFAPRVALAAAALLALAPAHAAWSVSGRGYAGYVLCVILFCFSYFRLLASPARRWQIVLVITAVTGIALHVYSLIFLTALMIHWLIYSTRIAKTTASSPSGLTAAWEALGISFITATVIFLPLTLTEWFQLASRQVHAPQPYFPITLWASLLSLPWLIPGLLAAGLLIWGLTRLQRQPQRLDIFLTILFVIMILIWLSRPRFLYERFWAGLLPFIFVGIVIALDDIRSRWRHGLIASGVIVLLLAAGAGWAWHQDRAPMMIDFTSHFREAVAFAQKNTSAKASLTSLQSIGELYGYYARQPVTAVSDPDAMQSWLTSPSPGACFVFWTLFAPDTQQTALNMLRSKSTETPFGDISVFIFKHQ